MILVLSQAEDLSVQPVVDELVRRGQEVAVFDTSWFPSDACLVAEDVGDGWAARLAGPFGELLLSKVQAVWFRFPGQFRLPADMGNLERRFALREARMGIGGLIRALDCLWVNHPEKMITAEYKPLQLTLARRVGLAVPRSIITNDPDAVMRFYRSFRGKIVYKTLSSPTLPAEQPEPRPWSVYTSLVREEHLARLEAVRYTACFFQEYVEKATELRLTVIGSEVFPVEIRSEGAPAESVDWRQHYRHLRYSIYPLPEPVRRACLALTERLSLKFAAIDMIVTPSGEYVFLELNPAGQWLWLESETGLPMVAAMADLLSGVADGTQL